MIKTLFLSPYQSAFPDYVRDPRSSKVFASFLGQEKYNVLYQRIEQYELDATQTRAVTFPGYSSSEWAVIIFRVIGDVTINTTGFDTDGTTPITGKLPGYGNELFPGIVILSTYNVSTFTVESFQDGSTVELYASIACADDDPRIDSNA